MHVQEGKRLPLEEKGEELGKRGRADCKVLHIKLFFSLTRYKSPSIPREIQLGLTYHPDAEI